jgi:hypothetical protein
MKSLLLSVLAIGLLLGASPGKADEQADAKALLDKAIKAMGGQEKLAKLATASVKGKLTGSPGGKDITLELDGLWQGMSQYRVEAEVQEGGNNFKGLLVFNGDMAWSRKGDNTRDAPEGVASFMQNIFYAGRIPQMLPAVSGQPYKVSLLGEVMVGTQAAKGILISHNDRKDVSLYFDKDNGLPIKSEVRVSEPRTNKEMTVEYRYGNFKDFAGLKLCGTVTVKLDEKEFTLELSEIKGIEKVDDSRFDRP